MVWPVVAALGSAVVGGITARNAAKKQAAAQKYAADTAAESFRFSKPYIQRSYDQAEDALAYANQQGVYPGQTVAPLDPYQILGANYLGQAGLAGRQGALDIMGSSQPYAQNFADIYGRSMSGNPIMDAQNFAASNSQPLIDRAMRDSARRLTESTLPGINLGASASGNVNSSRAGVAEALAKRGYGDRLADTTALVEDQLRNQYLTQNQQSMDTALAANRGLGASYATGIDAIGNIGQLIGRPGDLYRGYDQSLLDDASRRFTEDRDMRLNNQIAFQKGILGQADYQSRPYMAPTTSTGAATLGGAMQGFGAFADTYKNYQDLFGKPQTPFDPQEVSLPVRASGFYQRTAGLGG